MLMGCGMQNYLWKVLLKNTMHPRFVTDISHQRYEIDFYPATLEFLLNAEESKFSSLQEQDTGRSESGYLPDEFRANGTARTCNHYGLSGKEPAHTLLV